MNLLLPILNFFKKKESTPNGEWENCYHVLKTSLLKHKNEESRFESLLKNLKQWKKLSTAEKSEEFPALFLNLKAYISRKARLPALFEESFQEKVYHSLGKLEQEEEIRLVFDTEENQKILLSKYFIIKILEEAKEVLGSAGNNLLPRSIDFCKGIPDLHFEKIDDLNILTVKSENTLIVLKNFSHEISKKLSASFGDNRVSGFYKKSHQEISKKYSLLNVFPFVLDLIPEKYLKFEDLNTLDNAYIRDALKKTVEQLTEKNAEIEKKNKKLEKTELKLKKLASRLQVISDIDRTILRSDSLDGFIYSTLDVLQTRMNLEKTAMVFFDFDKKYYSEHILENGKHITNQKQLKNFDGDLMKLKNSEYDLIENEKQKLFYPIVEQGKLIASISFEKEGSIDFGNEFLDTVKEVSGGMAISIVNKKLEEELKKRNKDMTDSLYYAQRIQNALIPSFKNFNKLFEDSFVFFKPKDLVSGDFYWAHQTFDNRKIWITADCTGHGVPGAIMSVIGFNILNKIIIEKGVWEPNLILDELRVNIIETLTQKGDKHPAKDGMDISVCVYNPNRGTLQYSGALNSIFVIRADKEKEFDFDNFPKIKVHHDGLIELLPDKMPAAYFEGTNKPFSKTTIMIEKGDSIYSFSDGYADQFGGENDKKFMIRNFRTLLCSISHLPMRKQKVQIEEAFYSWMGDREQIDDLCVIGIKVKGETIF